MGLGHSYDLLKLNLAFRFEDYAQLAMDWEKRRMMLKSFTGPIVIMASGLDPAQKFGGSGLYINNDEFKWNKSKQHVKLVGAFIYINRDDRQVVSCEYEHLEARVEKDTATGFWIYVRKAAPGSKVKH